MNENRLLLALGSVDDKYIEEASMSDNTQAVVRRTLPVRWIAAACILCVLAAALSALPQISKNDADVTLSNNISFKHDKFDENIPHFDHSVTPPDSEDEKEPPSGIGFGSGGISVKKEAFLTYTFANVEEDIRLPAISADLSADTLPVYTVITEHSDGYLKEHYEKFASLIETRQECTESVTAQEADVYQVSLRVPDSGKEYTGQLMDYVNGSAVVIRSMNSGITVGYPLPGSTERRLDHDYILELVQTDPIVKAACKYAGITNPDIYFTHSYTTNEEYPRTVKYEIVESGTDVQTTAENLMFNSVYISISDSDAVSIGITDASHYEVQATYPVRSFEKAVSSFCNKYGLSQDDILMTGFRYEQAERLYQYVPYYELIVLNTSIPLSEGFDQSVYGNYDLILLPAVKMSETQSGEEESDSPSDSGYYDFMTGRCVMKDLSQIRLVDCANVKAGDKLPLYRFVEAVSDADTLKQRCDSLIAHLGLTDAASKYGTAENVNDNVYSVTIPLTDSVSSAENELVISADSGSYSAAAGYLSICYTDEGLLKRMEDPAFIEELALTDPIITAACDYIGITHPKLSYVIGYDIWGDPSLHCRIYEENSSAADCAIRSRYKSVIISVGYETPEVQVSIYDKDIFEPVEYRDAIDVDTAIQKCIDEFGITKDDILAVGFDYGIRFGAGDELYPYYEFLTRSDNEFIERYNMDASVFQEYNKLYVLAVS